MTPRSPLTWGLGLLLTGVPGIAWSQDDSGALGPELPLPERSVHPRHAASQTVGWIGAGLSTTAVLGLTAYTVDAFARRPSDGVDMPYIGLEFYAGIYGVLAGPAYGLMLGSGSVVSSGVLRRSGVDVSRGLGLTSLSLAIGTTAVSVAVVAIDHDEERVLLAPTVTLAGATVTGVLQLLANRRAFRATEPEAVSLTAPRHPLVVAPRLDPSSPGLLLGGHF